MNNKIYVLTLAFVGFASCYPHSVSIPPSDNKPARARYAVNLADWGALTSISTLDGIVGYPYASILSTSDGPIGNGTGIIYLYVTPFDPVASDFQVDNRCTLIISLAETEYCKQADLDPEDPRCIRVMISGRFTRVDPNSEEYYTGYQTLLLRHPAMAFWPPNHGFFVAKIDMDKITTFDNFGGLNDIPIQSYLDANL